jgi:DHA1 family inner membrane transport protein
LAILLPSTLSRAGAKLIDEQVKVLGSGRLLLVFAMTALGYGGTFVTFTYLAAILEQITGFKPPAVSLILVLYGARSRSATSPAAAWPTVIRSKALIWLFAAQALVLCSSALPPYRRWWT